MIPQSLQIEGFLSYKTRTEIDFSSLHLACITGHNGAGKSSLLDAITWALFGQARTRGENIINLQCDQAKVVFTFIYENTTYRIERQMERGKGSSLNFQIRRENQNWKTLSERSIRATQKRIENVLRLDYDTFVNAAFFLQGRADQFTQQTPSARKEILGKILGLEIWETYRQRTAERRRDEEMRRERIDAEIAAIDSELAEEPQRVAALENIRQELDILRQQLAAQKKQVEQAQHLSASLESQRQMVAALQTAVDKAAADLEARRERRRALDARAQTFNEIMAQAEVIRQEYAEWQTLQNQLPAFEALAARFREQEKALAAPRAEIAAEKARLEQERDTLLQQQAEIIQQQAQHQTLQAEAAALQQEIAQLKTRADEIAALQEKIQETRTQYLQFAADVDALRKATHEIKERIETLEHSAENQCPTCGQPLTEAHKADLIARLSSEGKDLAARFREQREQMEAMKQDVESMEQEIRAWEKQGQGQLHALQLKLARLDENIQQIEKTLTDWDENQAPRLQAVQQALAEETYAAEARQQILAVETELQALGYDAARHAALRARLDELGDIAARFRELESASASLREIQSQINVLDEEIAAAEAQLTQQKAQWEAQSVQLAAAEAQLPDLNTLKQDLLNMQEKVNIKSRELGAAEQRVKVLDEQRRHKAELQTKRDEISQTISRYQQLEKAFGKNGAPALIIEQALPQIEDHANEILARLSGGQMSLRFKTQAAYKDKKRKDLKETLDIEISDGAGMRSYEMFSGGEAFRINFAVRLALSKVLAQRKGARLQMLVIDEGFGSQDALGKQRLIEAINAIQQDFHTILVITHLEELKDAFPARIEISKTPSGSTVNIL